MIFSPSFTLFSTLARLLSAPLRRLSFMIFQRLICAKSEECERGAMAYAEDGAMSFGERVSECRR